MKKGLKSNRRLYLQYLILQLEKKRREQIQAAKESFWTFCQIEAPEFYTDDKTHLKQYCDTLQAFHENKLLNEKGKPHKILLIEMPPRHGKTRTLVLLCTWILGLKARTKIISSAYNDDLAHEISKFVRNTIGEQKTENLDIIYSDIFPKTKLKHGDASVKQWALSKCHFTLRAAGKGGTITGKGGNYLIVDDPVKSAEDAYNDLQLEKDWRWYTGTWLSRKEHRAKEIICHTPWAKKDIGGRIQTDKKRPYYLFKMPACKNKKMLCPSILNYDEYIELKNTMDNIIFRANYDLERIDVKGVLYGDKFKTYTSLPVDADGRELYTDYIMFVDTADTGNNYLCAIDAKLYNGLAYVTDVYYTKESVEKTEPEMAKHVADNTIKMARIEGNSAGHAIAVHVKDILEKEYQWDGTIFDTFTQTKNKISRIMSNAKQVIEKVLFPVDWHNRWPEFYTDVTEFKKEGKNKYDDAPDTLTQIVEYIDETFQSHFFIRPKR